LIGAWRSASGPSRVVTPRPPPGALRRHTPGACHPWSMPDFCRDLSATSCSRQQLSAGYSALYGRSTTQGLRQLTFIHCSALRTASK
jgi:hypothetical protein